MIALLLAATLAATPPSCTTTKTPPAFIGGAWNLITGDIDGDGKIDVVATGETVVVMYGRGDGTLEPAIAVPGTNRAFGPIVVADMNGDGRNDLLTTVALDRTSTRLVVLVTNAGGRSFVPAFIGGITDGSVAAAADFTNDGNPDVLLLRYPGGPVFLISDGEGHFPANAGQVQADYTFFGVTAGDVDGDGLVDLVGFDKSSEKLVLTPNQDNLTFGPPVTIEDRGKHWPETSPMLADLNRDGHLDVVSIHHWTRDFSIFYGGPEKKAVQIESPVACWRGTAVHGDFNGDGAVDLAILFPESISGAPRVVVYRNDGLGGFASAYEFPAGEGPSNIAAADLNGDGILDLVIPTGHLGVSVMLGNGDATFRFPRTLAAPAGSTLFAAADFNGDGIDEVVNAVGGQQLFVGSLTGSGEYAYEELRVQQMGYSPRVAIGEGRLIAVEMTWMSQKLAVFARGSDGWKRIATHDAGGTVDAVAEVNKTIYFISRGLVQKITPSGAFQTVGLVEPNDQYFVRVTDIDRDGQQDLIVAGSGERVTNTPGDDRMGTAFVTLFRGRDGSLLTGDRVSQSTGGVLDVVDGDFNADGNPDLAMATLDETTLGTFVLYGDGKGKFEKMRLAWTGRGAISYATGRRGSLASADFDGDGIADLVMFAPDGLSIFRGSPDGLAQRDQWLTAGEPVRPVLVRRRAFAPPAILTTLGWNEMLLLEFDCIPSRRRGVRH